MSNHYEQNKARALGFLDTDGIRENLDRHERRNRGGRNFFFPKRMINTYRRKTYSVIAPSFGFANGVDLFSVSNPGVVEFKLDKKQNHLLTNLFIELKVKNTFPVATSTSIVYVRRLCPFLRVSILKNREVINTFSDIFENKYYLALSTKKSLNGDIGSIYGDPISNLPDNPIVTLTYNVMTPFSNAELPLSEIYSQDIYIRIEFDASALSQPSTILQFISCNLIMESVEIPPRIYKENYVDLLASQPLDYISNQIENKTYSITGPAIANTQYTFVMPDIKNTVHAIWLSVGLTTFDTGINVNFWHSLPLINVKIVNSNSVDTLNSSGYTYSNVTGVLNKKMIYDEFSTQDSIYTQFLETYPFLRPAVFIPMSNDVMRALKNKGSDGYFYLGGVNNQDLSLSFMIDSSATPAELAGGLSVHLIYLKAGYLRLFRDIAGPNFEYRDM